MEVRARPNPVEGTQTFSHAIDPSSSKEQRLQGLGQADGADATTEALVRGHRKRHSGDSHRTTLHLVRSSL